MKRDDARLFERWDDVDRLFEASLDLPEAERARFVERACGEDAELRDLVLSLVEHAGTRPDHLSGPGTRLVRAVWEDEAPEPAEGATLEAGERVGRYRLTELLGRGGMATVYAAQRDDGAYRQEVAVKVLRADADADVLIERFVHERQILSRLAHPRIARLLDGGATAEGRPFLVMERVEGRPITRYSDERRLTVRQRLKLLLEVTDAVRFAHQRLIVHSDLKPSNILVDAEGHAKLLDFGIAKLLDDVETERGPLTRVGIRAHTPEYASPEQVRGEPVTTASDVYQLGLLLYELLTGRRPFTGQGLRLESAITGGHVTRPSEATAESTFAKNSAPAFVPSASPVEIATARRTTPEGLRRALTGDLDTIVLQALKAEPEERYGSVDAFAEDIRNYLAGRPIQARPATLPYRLRKFVQRNRWFTPAAAAVLVAAAGYVATLAMHAQTLERERNEARAHAERADELRLFLLELFRVADPYGTPDPARNREITVVEALDIGAERARTELADRPLLLADILSAVGGVYANLDQREPAVSTLEQAIGLRLRAGAGGSVEHRDDLNALAGIIGLEGDADSAAALQRHRLTLELENEGPEHARVGRAHLSLSAHLVTSGRFDEALEHREAAVRILRASGPDAAVHLADALSLIADTYAVFDRMADAEAAAREAAEISRRTLGPTHPSTALHTVHVAQVLSNTGRAEEAIALYREVLPVLERAFGPEHYITLNSTNNLGFALAAAGDAGAAEEVYREMIDIRRRMASGGISRDVADGLQNLAGALRSQGRMEEAERLIGEAHGMYRAVLPEGHYMIAFPLLSLAEIQLAREDAAGAEASMREAVGILTSGLPAGHYATAVARCRLGAALAMQDRHADAAPLIEAALHDLRGSDRAPPRFLEECTEYQTVTITAPVREVF